MQRRAGLGLCFFAALVLGACSPDPSADRLQQADGASAGGGDGLIGDLAADSGENTDRADPALDAETGSDGLSDIPPIIIPDGDVVRQALALNSLIPNRGLSTGGTAMQIIGTGFGPELQILFDNETPCLDLVVESINRAHCVTPPHVVGRAHVLAIQPSNDPFAGPDAVDQSLLVEAFSFYEVVSVTVVEPSRVPVRGGLRLVIRGTGLLDGTRVKIGGVDAPDAVAQADGSLFVSAPPGVPGPADVEVSNFNGMARLERGVFYYEAVDVSAILPPAGPISGGTAIELRGAGLTLDSVVTFGDLAVGAVEGNDLKTSLTFSSPAAPAAGFVDVTVTNQNGVVTLPGGFLYFDADVAGFALLGLSPSSGPVEGGNRVRVVGAGFSAATEVTLEDGRALDCDFIDGNQLDCEIPPGDVGSVDVRATDGGDTSTLSDAYTYFQTLEVIAVRPDDGAIAGGTFVVVTGTGFSADTVIDLGGQALIEAVVVDETRIEGRTPQNTPGAVDVRAITSLTRNVLPAGFTYFDPVNQFGGVWGDPIRGAVNVTVYHAQTGQPLDEVSVFALSEETGAFVMRLTNPQGQTVLSEEGLRGPLNITAAKEGFEVTTIEDALVENITIYLTPNTSEMGPPPPGVRAAILRGVVSGLDLIPKPDRESRTNIIVIETTHSSPFNRPDLPPPGPGGLLKEDGPFEIIARPGELAIVATAGEIDVAVLKDFEDGLLDYWSMRQNLVPVQMGLRRFISASPGQEIAGLDVNLDHPMDLTIPVDLDNPPLGGVGGPEYYAVLPRLNLGAEGFWEIDSQAVALDPALSLGNMPSLDGWDQDVTYYFFGLAFTPSADNTPMSVTIQETRDIEAGVLITPFVGAPFVQAPGLDGVLTNDRTVRWGVYDGFEGPITPPHANLVLIQEPALGPPKPLWRYVTPSLVTEYTIPEAADAVEGAGLGDGVMILTILPFYVDGLFNFEEFTYDELAQFRWKAWAVGGMFFSKSE